MEVFDYTQIETLDEKKKTAPIRFLSFDIECLPRIDKNGKLDCVPEKDSVIRIANYVWVLGDPEPIIRNVFSLQQQSSMHGTMVYDFDDEAEMLKAWQRFIAIVDPDIFTG